MSCELPQGLLERMCAKAHQDISCDMPHCQRVSRVHINGDPGVLPKGWGSLLFCPGGAGAGVQLEFCPTHLKAVVVPWIALLEAKELEAFDLGPPADDQDSPLPIAHVKDGDEDDSDDADDSDPVLFFSATGSGDSDVVDDLAGG